MTATKCVSHRRRLVKGAVLAGIAIMCMTSAPVAMAAEAMAGGLPGARMSLWWALPFVGILFCIATGPVLYADFWERHEGKFAAFWGLLAAVPLLIWAGPSLGTTALLEELLLDYLPFIILLFALFTIAGGIWVEGNIHGTPATNTLLLAISTLLASFIGTTGAAMVMIRPLIRANDGRRCNAHVIVFFIFLACNVGGAMTPLGDPPLFVGFLRGVHFFWPMEHVWPETLFVVAVLLALFFVIDTYFYRREEYREPDTDPTPDSRLQLHGLVNIPLLLGVIGAILLSAWWRPGMTLFVHGVPMALQNLVRDALILVMAGLSLWLTQVNYRHANHFSWAPIREVAILFAAIFVCLVPVAAILRAGADGAFAPLVAMVTRPDGTADAVAYFWATGILSSFLDNTPTYLVFFDLAGGDPGTLMTRGVAVLAAISTGAVFMGANSYIGNAPNFMVYAIAKRHGVHMPHFFAYMAWSVAILIPVFLLVGWVFYT